MSTEEIMNALKVLTPVAIDKIKEVLEDVNTPAMAKVKAAEVVLHFALNNPTPGEDTEASLNDNCEIEPIFSNGQHDEWSK